MLKSKSKITVRYSEVDKMNFIYYSRHLEYFEVARADWLKHHLIPYSEIENKYRVLLPVVECNICYFGSARYDEKLIVECNVDVKQIRKTIVFEYKIFNDEKEIASGFTKHLFYDDEIGKVIEIPSELKNIMK